jgi:hypothetical protein
MYTHVVAEAEPACPPRLGNKAACWVSGRMIAAAAWQLCDVSSLEFPSALF